MDQDNNPLQNYVYSSEMLDLVKAANGYCHFLEEIRESGEKSFIDQSVQYLSIVYYIMLRIGETEPLFDSSPEPAVTEQEWATIHQRISLLLGAHNDFVRTAETDEYDRSDLVTHTISEDMADIYQELRDFTSIYSRGLEELINDAAWELKERFIGHWGKKLLRSLSALHDLFVKGIDPESEGDIRGGNPDLFTDPLLEE